MRHQQVFHLLRVDVLAAGVEHVVGAAPEVEEAVRVPVEEVAGREPSVLDPLRCDGRQVVVAGSDAGVADPELAVARVLHAVVHELDLAFGPRRPATPPGHGSAVDGRSQHHRPSLREPVALAHLHPERPFDGIQELRLHRRRAHGDRPKGRKVQLANQLHVVQRNSEHGRDRAHPSALVLAQCPEERLRLEAREDHRRAAGLKQRLHSAQHRVLVIKGHRHQRPLPRFERPMLLRALKPPELAGVRQDHALGLPGRA